MTPTAVELVIVVSCTAGCSRPASVIVPGRGPLCPEDALTWYRRQPAASVARAQEDGTCPAS